MSGKLDGIDLNSQGDSIEASDDAGIGNCLENETSKKFYCDPHVAGGLSVDGDRVLGEAIDSSVISGSVHERLKAEVDDVDRDESFMAKMDGVNRDPGVKEDSGNMEVFEGHGTLKNDGHLDVEAPNVRNCEAEAKIEMDQNQGLGVGVFPQHAREMINLVVDLNAQNAEGNVMSSNGIGNKGTAFKEGLIELNLPSAENTAPIKEADLSGYQNFLEYVDEKGVKHDALIPQCRGRESQTEKDGEFYVADLVWAKVRSHPWWPGQIFEPSAASDKAMKYFKKDSYLVAYFGDQTFAWNEASKIKPFRMYFSQMEKQSDVEAFSRAVDGALDEVSRRVETGLACRCLPEGKFAKVKSQVVVNAGIREQSSRLDGGDSFSTAASFVPEKLINYLKSVAVAPSVGINRLEFTTARAQFLAFSKWKGNFHLPVLVEFNRILENDAEPPLSEEKKNYYKATGGVYGSNMDDQVTREAKSATQDGPRKRNRVTLDDQCKEAKGHKWELMSGTSSSSLNGSSKFEEKARKITSISSSKKRKAANSISSESGVKRSKRLSSQMVTNKTPSLPDNYLEAGEHIRRVAGKPAGSQRTIAEHDEKSLNMSSAFGVSTLSAGRDYRGRILPHEYPPTDEMLSKLVVAAECPMDSFISLTPVASFFSEFRNSICLECNNICQEKTSSWKQKLENSSNLETTEALKFDGVEDSYWTDRIIQSSLDEQVLFEPETRGEKDTIANETEDEDGFNVTADNNHEMSAKVTQQESENPSEIVDEKSESSPTALVLSFTDLESVPSTTNLNNIFNVYGPLHEAETEVLSKRKRAKVVFKRRSDAETAFSSTGKFSIFGPSLVSYRLKYLPKLRIAPTASKIKRRRKNATSAEDSAM